MRTFPSPQTQGVAPRKIRRTVDEIRPGYSFDETCPSTVPEAITCALGGDADTLAAIAGPIAEAMHGIPAHLVATARVRAHSLTQALDLVDVIKRLYSASETAGDGDTVNTLTRSEC